jgi:hypothetical protein
MEAQKERNECQRYHFNTWFSYIYIHRISFLYRVLPRTLPTHSLESPWADGTEDSFLADEPGDNVHKTLLVPQSLPESAFLVLHQVELSRYSQVSFPLGGQRFELDLCPFLLQQSTGRGDTGNAGTFIRTVSPALNCIGQVTLIICVPIKTSKTCPGMACGGKVRWTTALKQKGGRLWLLCEFDWLYSLDSHYCSLVSLLWLYATSWRKNASRCSIHPTKHDWMCFSGAVFSRGSWLISRS